LYFSLGRPTLDQPTIITPSSHTYTNNQQHLPSPPLPSMIPLTTRLLFNFQQHHPSIQPPSKIPPTTYTIPLQTLLEHDININGNISLPFTSNSIIQSAPFQTKGNGYFSWLITSTQPLAMTYLLTTFQTIATTKIQFSTRPTSIQ
jgi:hypothetical protein